MPIMVKCDDVRSGTKAKVRHGGLLPAHLSSIHWVPRWANLIVRKIFSISRFFLSSSPVFLANFKIIASQWFIYRANEPPQRTSGWTDTKTSSHEWLWMLPFLFVGYWQTIVMFILRYRSWLIRKSILVCSIFYGTKMLRAQWLIILASVPYYWENSSRRRAHSINI